MRSMVFPAMMIAGLALAWPALAAPDPGAGKAGKAGKAGSAATPPAADAPANPFVKLGQLRGRLGAEVVEMSDDLRRYFGAPAGRGVLVNRVGDGTPARGAGLLAGDVIVEVDGEAIDRSRDVGRALADRKKGDKVAIAVLRDRRRVTLDATLAEDPSPVVAFGPGSVGLDPFDLPAGLGAVGAWKHAWGRGDLEKKLEAMEERLERLEKKR